MFEFPEQITNIIRPSIQCVGSPLDVSPRLCDLPGFSAPDFATMLPFQSRTAVEN